MVSTASYRAPELTQVPSETVIDERVDVWSMGCLLYAMAFGRSPFDSPTEVHAFVLPFLLIFPTWPELMTTMNLLMLVR